VTHTGRARLFGLTPTSVGLWIQGLWQLFGTLVISFMSFTMAAFENVPVDAVRSWALIAFALIYSMVVLRAAFVVWQMRRETRPDHRAVLLAVMLGNSAIATYSLYRIASGADAAFFGVGLLGAALTAIGIGAALSWSSQGSRRVEPVS
jgi:hypothetical protein